MKRIIVLTSKLFIYDLMAKTKINTYLIYTLLMLILSAISQNIAFAQDKPSIRLKDMASYSGIDFIHYAPRPRWCEIGPTVVGAATNDLDAMRMNFLTERCLITQGANNFMLMK